jgi:uncharacterized protein YbjT (DUF2867 family)
MRSITVVKKNLMSTQKQKILVAGANGTTGKIIIDLLKNSDRYQPIAMVRKKEQIEQFESQQVATVLADLEEDVNHAVTNAEKLIFAAGSGGKKVVAVDQEGAKKLVDASKRAGIKKFVMLSSMGADDPSQNEELQEYLKAKQNADNYLRDSGLNYSIVRPGQLTNDSANGAIQLEEKIGKSGEIPRADVAQTLVDVLDNTIKAQQTFEIIKGNTPIDQALRSS